MQAVRGWWPGRPELPPWSTPTQILNSEILPTLERLRGEKEAYYQWQQANQEVERLKRLLIAHEYMLLDRIVNDPEGELGQQQQAAQAAEEAVSEAQRRITEREGDIRALETEKASGRASALSGR